MIATLEPCRAGFDGCDAMRADEVAKHPRTAAARECRHMPIPPERPDKLQGPEVGARVIFHSTYPRHDGEAATVTERSYVWAPGDPSYHGGSRRYDWTVIRFDGGGSLCVDDKDLTSLTEG
jgi:hypothetical protein